jgi:acetylornithine deacetylase/succinyl-diaminopimelate desuccinylase-like protein
MRFRDGRDGAAGIVPSSAGGTDDATGQPSSQRPSPQEAAADAESHAHAHAHARVHAGADAHARVHAGADAEPDSHTVAHTPTITVPIANHDNNQHSFDENIRLENLWDGIDLLAALLAI